MATIEANVLFASKEYTNLIRRNWIRMYILMDMMLRGDSIKDYPGICGEEDGN